MLFAHDGPKRDGASLTCSNRREQKTQKGTHLSLLCQCQNMNKPRKIFIKHRNFTIQIHTVRERDRQTDKGEEKRIPTVVNAPITQHNTGAIKHYYRQSNINSKSTTESFLSWLPRIQGVRNSHSCNSHSLVYQFCENWLNDSDQRSIMTAKLMKN